MARRYDIRITLTSQLKKCPAGHKVGDEFVVTGAWAFERYSYESTDTSLEDGSAYKDTGRGLVI